MPRHFDGGKGRDSSVRMWIIQNDPRIFLFPAGMEKGKNIHITREIRKIRKVIHSSGVNGFKKFQHFLT